MDKMTIDECEM